jgi:hypothetical protein
MFYSVLLHYCIAALMQASYCSTECQRLHWKEHKKECALREQQQREEREQSDNEISESGAEESAGATDTTHDGMREKGM